MQFLAEELDDKDPEPCGKCENCAPEKALSTEYSENIAIEAAKFLQNIDIQIKPKKRAGSSNDDARWRFPIYQLPYSLAKDGLMHEYGRVLCYWGDAGWGEMSKEGKEKYKAFDTRLVSASAKLIKEKWKPESFPSWLTFVPSNRSELVANFADELANALGIKFFDVVKKIKHNKPQKKMENANYRCKNLDGVFEISANIPKGSVLLVDDIYDSGWTFAVISALLRRSGSDKVFPFAVASTSNN
jgi:ATP-dependent DNA helicase RecQ